MIEKIIIEYLTAQGFLSFLEMPKTMPQGNFIIIQKTGSSISNHIKSATVAIQTYSNSLVGAIELNEQVKAVMDNIIDLDDIGGCELNSDYNFTDTAIKKYRYQAVFDITYY